MTEDELYKLAAHAGIKPSSKGFKAAKLMLLDGFDRAESCRITGCIQSCFTTTIQRIKAADIRIKLESKNENGL